MSGRRATVCPPCDAGQHSPVQDGRCRCCHRDVPDRAPLSPDPAMMASLTAERFGSLAALERERFLSPAERRRREQAHGPVSES